MRALDGIRSGKSSYGVNSRSVLHYAGVAEVKIRAVLFDLGITLVRTWIPEVTFRSVLSSFGIDTRTEAIRKAIEKTEEDF